MVYSKYTILGGDMQNLFRGVFTIPPAVYRTDLEVDYDGIKRAVRFCLDCGAHGIVIPVYATEYFVLSDEERKKIVEAAVREVDGRIPVIAGVTSAYVKVSVDLAEHAEAAGADGIIAAPPHLMKVSEPELFDYYRQINDAVHLPVMVQHLFPPLGTVMSARFIMRLITELEHVEYLKEESPRTNNMISAITDLNTGSASPGLHGILGGNGSRNIIEEYQRGVCGTMPPSQFTDVVVDIWDLLEQGDISAAFELHRTVLPALLYGGTYPIVSYKHILKRRGVVDFAGCRPAGWPAMDELSFSVLDSIMDSVKHVLRVQY
jgi:dihydrodipicolinate synthase/N-acetylneuraminate lyase